MKKAIVPILIFALLFGACGCSNNEQTPDISTSSIIETTDTFYSADRKNEMSTIWAYLNKTSTVAETTTSETSSTTIEEVVSNEETTVYEVENTEAPKPETLPVEITEETPQGNIVYVTRTGECYHSNPNCGNISNPMEITLDDAINQGYRPCSKCYYGVEETTQEEQISEPEPPTETTAEEIPETTPETAPFIVHDITYSCSDGFDGLPSAIASSVDSYGGYGYVCPQFPNEVFCPGNVWEVQWINEAGEVIGVTNVYFTE